ncbi:MAG: RNA polymerase subunit sigma [Kofleriaceae bacterium]|nr:RNA polymerase subunit sigma [Myxococcales bacterium]MCB9565102.1 RNA polymerase subunit sigma [Kofleriaceae bacterium]MCB9570827.1 RNA polymerase subunit sigma [Kofleriaceae bacterium]
MGADASVTELLGELAGGDGTVYDRVFTLVYEQLHRIAGAQLARERPGHTVSPTVLVHEAYLHLVDQTRATFASRAHFLSVAALAMRRILVDHAVARRALKRGGGDRVLTFDEEAGAGAGGGGAASFADVLAIDGLLERLATAHPRPARVVVCRIFGGLTDAEIAGALDVAVPTVRRDWRFARAWLTRALEAG